MASKTNCVINGIPYYRIRYTDGVKLNKEGKLVTNVIPFYGKNKTEAEGMRNEYITNKKSGMKNEKSYFYDVAKYYTYNVLTNTALAEGTIGRYESAYKTHIKTSQLANIIISEISSRDIQTFYNKLKEDGNSIATLKAINKYLSRFFKYCEMEGYCFKNPLLSVVIPRGNEEAESKLEKDDDEEEGLNEITTFSSEEIGLIEKQSKDRLRFMLFLALSSGMRVSELLAIRYSDFTDNGIMVKKQLLKALELDGEGSRTYKYKVVNPKTKSSIRFLPLPKSVMAELAVHKAKHQAEMLKNNYRTQYVFTCDNGNFIDKTNLRRQYMRFLKKAGIAEKKFHSLRATYCTQLCISGVPLQVASELMGHADITTTAKYYAFISEKQKTDAVDKLNDLFLPKIDMVK